MAVKPSFNGVLVIYACQDNIMGKDADLNVLIDQLRDTFTDVKGGDLHTHGGHADRPRCGAANHFHQLGTQGAISGISKALGGVFGAGLESEGTKPVHHIGTCRFEVTNAGQL